MDIEDRTCACCGGDLHVALPVSMAIAIASGAAPERGYTAIIGGFRVSLLDGSRFQIRGLRRKRKLRAVFAASSTAISTIGINFGQMR